MQEILQILLGTTIVLIAFMSFVKRTDKNIERRQLQDAQRLRLPEH